MPPGVVYALRNVSLPGLLKIGGSKRSGKVRRKELSNTSLPTHFDPVYEQPVSNWQDAEKLAHEKLSEWRDQKRREFFRVSEARAIDVLKDVALKFPTTSRADSVGVEVVTIGPLRHARIIECQHAGLEAQWKTPSWIAVDDPVNYSQVPEVDFFFAGETPAPRFIASVWSVEQNGERWALCTGNYFTDPANEARDTPLKVSIYRKQDRLRARLVSLVTSVNRLDGDVSGRMVASSDAMNSLLGTWSRKYKDAQASVYEAIAAHATTAEALEAVVADPTRWIVQERRGFWMYKRKLYQVVRDDVADEEAAILVKHHAEHERARIRRLEEEAARLASDDDD